MKEEVRELMPKWMDSKEDFNLMFGDDVDSLFTMRAVQYAKGWNPNYFFDFEREFIIDPVDETERIGCDMCIMKGKSFDNHVFLLDAEDTGNEELANLNAAYRIHRGKYTQKYAGSTLLLVMSYYNIPLPETQEGKLILMAIDSAYLGHYNDRFKPVHNEWLRKLGYEELIDFLDTVTKEDFSRVINKYKLNKKIFPNNKGRLKTDINLDEINEHFVFDTHLPDDQFILHKQYALRGNVNILEHDTGKKPLRKNERVVSFALTYKNTASFTLA